MVLSMSQPGHLRKIKLIDKESQNSFQEMINSLMATALVKIPILPWSYLVDVWRWKVFSGEIKKNEYQSYWEHLVEKYQGIHRPEPAAKDSFDPGSKYHIPVKVF